jgi:transposase
MDIATEKTEYPGEVIDERDKKIADLESRVASLSARVKFFEEMLRLATANKFGKSSEKAIPIQNVNQISMFNEAEDTADEKVPEPEFETVTIKRRKRSGKRAEDLEGLPVETVECNFDGEQACPECGEPMHVCGHELARKELIIIPAHYSVREYVREVASCRNCERNSDHTPMIKAEVPQPVIKGSIASPELVSNIMCQKYVNGIPLYRQESDLLRQDITLSRQTMANWVIRAADDWLFPLYRRLRESLLGESVLHADESTLEVLKEPGRKAETKSYMWLYETSGSSSRRIVVFDYQQTRAAEHPRDFLARFKGYLHCDGYQAYRTLPDVVIVGCFVHARRKFTDVIKSIPNHDEKKKSAANVAIEYFGKLAKLEHDYEGLPYEERHRRRLAESKPIAEELFSWAAKVQALPKSKLGEAVTYLANQREWLMNVYLDGRLEWSNNRAERNIKPYVIGRKNWLFCDTPRGAKASATVYSVIETAKENELKPYQYLRYLFEKMPNITISQIDDLLPWSPNLPEYIRNSKPILPRAYRSDGQNSK